MPEQNDVSEAAQSDASHAPNNIEGLRLGYLDGLRGLAALYVVLFHAWGEMSWSKDGVNLSIVNSPWMQWVQFGHYAVVVFIVLSGYCLMMPVARRKGQLHGTFRVYVQRRAPDSAGLLCRAVFFSADDCLRAWPQSNRQCSLGFCAAAFTPSAILSHLFLIHNLNSGWVYKINNPMWSVGTEWQIYFFFPLFLLPIWKRMGNFATIAAGLLIGIAFYYLMHKQSPSCPWFIGLFAMGMAAASINFSSDAPARSGREDQLWNLWALLCLTVVISLSCLFPKIAHYGIFMDALFGAMTGCLLIYCTFSLKSAPVDKPTPWILRLLQSPLAIGLGQFSYSLYLTHFVILGFLHLELRSAHIAPQWIFVLMMVAGPILSLGFARVFYEVFEKPFLRKPMALKNSPSA